MSNTALSAEPAEGGICRICGTKLGDGSLSCQHCGATYGESNRCPHCRSVSDVEPSAVLRFRCRVCGGPRVPVEDTSVVRSGREIPLLIRTQRARMRTTAWRLGALVVLGFGVLSLLVTLLVSALVSPGIVGTLGMLAALAVPFVVSALAWRRAVIYRKELNEGLDKAWLLVASDVLASSPGELGAARLSQALRIDDTQAERLLAELNVEDFVHARVTDEGDVVYSSRVPTQIRVDASPPELEPAGPADSASADHDADELASDSPAADRQNPPTRSSR